MDIIIVGAGAGGLACAIQIKKEYPDAAVTVLEHLEEPCKKLHATGNGRCNLTNKEAEGYATTKAFFESLGLVLREDGEGRMYPYANQAVSVVNTLLAACAHYGVSIVTECNVYKAEKSGDHFNVYTTNGGKTCDILVLATGGKAQKGLGSDGSGYALAQGFGHTVTPLSPALVQLTSSSKHCRALKGVRCKCRLSLEINGDLTASDDGELLFTDYGLSGIVTMNLSRYVSDERLQRGKDKCVAVVDFVPELSEEQLAAHQERFGTLEGILPAKLCRILEKQAGGDNARIAQYAKHWRLIITGTKGYTFAQITAGGVAADELDAHFASALCDGLYIIGELTDHQFACGGFNLDFAFSGGVLAANAIVERIKSTDTEEQNDTH